MSKELKLNKQVFNFLIDTHQIFKGSAKKVFQFGTGFARNSEVKNPTNQIMTGSRICKIERVRICSASRSPVDFDVWSLLIPQEANFPTFGLSAATAEFPVNSSSFLQDILVLQESTYTNTKVVKLIEFLPTF